jgi:hypothetical protein
MAAAERMTGSLEERSAIAEASGLDMGDAKL